MPRSPRPRRASVSRLRVWSGGSDRRAQLVGLVWFEPARGDEWDALPGATKRIRLLEQENEIRRRRARIRAVPRQMLLTQSVAICCTVPASSGTSTFASATKSASSCSSAHASCRSWPASVRTDSVSKRSEASHRAARSGSSSDRTSPSRCSTTVSTRSGRAAPSERTALGCQALPIRADKPTISSLPRYLPLSRRPGAPLSADVEPGIQGPKPCPSWPSAGRRRSADPAGVGGCVGNGLIKQDGERA